MRNSNKKIPIKELYGLDSINSKNLESIDLKHKKEIKKILIIKWGGMGDIILATSIMEDIYTSFPKSKIHLNTLPEWKSLFHNDQRFEKIWGTKKSQEVGLLKHLYSWIKEIKSENYDLIIDLQTNDRTRIYLTILKMIKKGPEFIIGNHPVFPYSIFPKKINKIEHPFHLLQRTINTIGVESKTIHPKLYITKEENKLGLDILKKNNLIKKKYVVFICGSNRKGKLKRWGAQNFVELSNLIRSYLNLKVILIGGPDDISECELISCMDKRIINLCNKTKLKVLPNIFKNAKFIIGNDTGTSHLVAATKTPMIEIFGPTDPKKSKPLRKTIIAVKASHSSMNNVSANYIFNKIKEIL
jgi:heptosyltransferase-2